MKKFTPVILTLFVVAAFSCNNSTQKNKTEHTLAEARKGFKTQLIKINKIEDPAEEPPQDLFSIVSYPTPIGNMTAYLGKIPDDGKLHPAIIWITGGFGNDIGDVWSEASPDNDQSAADYSKAGIIMMHPAQRGGNGNPGSDESFFGEIDDIIAAADFLAKQKGIDPNRIYLGGHSTGGTKVLLAAECTNKFRAVFSFGPGTAAAEYGPDNLTYNTTNEQENRLRAPALWLSSLQTPVFVFEGDQNGNMDAVKDLERIAKKEDNQFLHCHIVKGKDHFSVLQPTNQEIAQKILADDKKGAVTMSFE
ncbi:dienelactone hydrolase [Filimonas zeae]|uniref:Peptidase S9 prolyl oligopeptidase catalytic domain-containing protein n=1 Tax=Filimonas zeae TaxID=1737353 RepID=A0A917MWD3_9BACT|nr:prolyl oligopeptidase family serine peptidase [Filimonas zeae]MDR6339823.1 dienelactone hydrolase [Filimonas zeae]GGH69824.1 hypothetical protein GCM10011379_27510 [Filimonas zeae]